MSVIFFIFTQTVQPSYAQISDFISVEKLEPSPIRPISNTFPNKPVLVIESAIRQLSIRSNNNILDTIIDEARGYNTYIIEQGRHEITIEIKDSPDKVIYILNDAKPQEVIYLKAYLTSVPKGHLEIKSSPSDAKVYILGLFEEFRTPILLRNVDANKKLTLSFEKEGYLPQTIDVEIVRNRINSIDVNLEKEIKYGDVIINTSPSEAEIRLDGKRIENNKEFKLPYGEYLIEAEAFGYIKNTFPLIVDSNKKILNIKMDKDIKQELKLTEVKSNTATVSGSIKSVSKRYQYSDNLLCYSYIPNVGINSNCIMIRRDYLNFSIALKNLEENTNYYVSIFTKVGEVYFKSEESIFKTSRIQDEFNIRSIQNIYADKRAISFQINVDQKNSSVTGLGACYTNQKTIETECIPSLPTPERRITLTKLKPSTDYLLYAYVVDRSGISHNGPTTTVRTTGNEAISDFWGNNRRQQLIKQENLVGNNTSINLSYITAKIDNQTYAKNYKMGEGLEIGASYDKLSRPISFNYGYSIGLINHLKTKNNELEASYLINYFIDVQAGLRLSVLTFSVGGRLSQFALLDNDFNTINTLDEILGEEVATQQQFHKVYGSIRINIPLGSTANIMLTSKRSIFTDPENQKYREFIVGLGFILDKSSKTGANGP